MGINFLDISTDFCSGDTLFIFQIAHTVIKVLQIAVPFALIIWGSLDFFKAVIAGDDKEMKQKRKPFIQRVIAALIVLLLPTIVNVIMKNIAKNANNNFATCWNKARSGNSIKIPNSSGNGNWETN